MGGDRVFLHCNGGEDIWQVFNDAVHFFGMLFDNIHKWSEQDTRYERGAFFPYMLGMMISSGCV